MQPCAKSWSRMYTSCVQVNVLFLNTGYFSHLFNIKSPFEQVRMQLYGQLNPGKPVPSFATILSNMVKSDGITSIYKGVDAAIGRQLVYGTARIGLHRAISDELKVRNEGKPISFAMKTLSGMASGSIAVCIGTPFDIALVRLQSDSMAPAAERKNYKNVMDALTRTVKEEGPAALYKGLAPNVLRGMSMNVGQLACYDQAKEMVAKLLNDPMTNGPAFTTQIGASLVAVSFTCHFGGVWCACVFRDEADP
jgi:solute carrier family 25 oxoglutarate transporter 11